jgi:transposase
MDRDHKQSSRRPQEESLPWHRIRCPRLPGFRERSDRQGLLAFRGRQQEAFRAAPCEGGPEVLRLMTHPGVGPTTALAFVLIIDSAERFACGKRIASYVGLIPCEDSSADRRRLGHITKQGNSRLRFLLVEAAQAVVRRDPDWRRRYTHLAMRRDKRIAKVAMARKPAVHLYWMMRKEWNYEQSKKFGSYAEESDYVHGVQ